MLVFDDYEQAQAQQHSAKEDYNSSSNKIKDQATLFKRAKISHGYVNQHQKQAFR